jgi:hypothetical protein
VVVEVSPILSSVAQELKLTEIDLLEQGARALLERQLLRLRAELFQIYGRYAVRSVEEMEARYQEGTLDEATSWRDLQRLDHLEYERDRLSALWESLG